MAFVISKESIKKGKTRELYYLVENYRSDGKIKRRTLLRLEECKTVAELYELTIQEQKMWYEKLSTRTKQLEALINRTDPRLAPYYTSIDVKAHFRRKVWGADYQVKQLTKKIEVIKSYM